MFNINFIIRLLLATFAAASIWAWIRILGGMLVSGNLNSEYLSLLLHSVSTLYLALNAFLLASIPVFIAWALGLFHQTRLLQLIILVCLGAAGGLTFHFSTWGLSATAMPVVFQYLLASVIGGVISGAVLWAIMLMPSGKTTVTPAHANDMADPQRRVLVSFGAAIGGLGVVASTVGPARIFRRSGDYLDIDVSKMKEGELLTAEMGNTPVWILKRTDTMIDLLNRDNPELYDPDSKHSQQPEAAKNQYRSIDPRYFVAIGICTHLGCAPKYLPEGDTKQGLSDLPQLFCPCHGGVFDLAGRVLRGRPPPRNLDIPNYEIMGSLIRIYSPTLYEVWSRVP